jgi:hypothetical protein
VQEEYVEQTSDVIVQQDGLELHVLLTLMNAYIPMENVTIYVSMKGDHIDVSVQMALP